MKFSNLTSVIHFIGIGGIGMSGVAQVLHAMGYKVQGSDLKDSPNTQRLKAQGIPVFIGHSPHHLDRVAVVVISSDVKSDNPELLEARRLRLPVIKRAEMLAELMRLKQSVAIAGTHGKTTTTSLVAALLEGANFDPTVVNGGIVNAYGTNSRVGQGDWIVVEADESDGSFTKLPLTVGLITNIDPEHMEYYKTTENLEHAFATFIEHIPFYGFGVLCADHPRVLDLYDRCTDRRLFLYGRHERADYRLENLRPQSDGTVFDVALSHDEKIEDLFLPMVGEHNVQNATGAVAIAHQLGIEAPQIRRALENFKGVKRRFTKVGIVQGATIIDDYAHHPKEIQVVIKAARQAAEGGRVIAVIQPHRYSRLSNHFEEFVSCVQEADEVILLPLYSAGEKEIPGISSEALAKAIKHPHVISLDHEDLLPDLLRERIQEGDYVICMGAGSITSIAQALPLQLSEGSKKQACGR